ncbi:MAG TPA: polysaccharide deacetylase family protein [Polyangiaceae bacterium]|nr:polysaccharide deacetylase family protein [Polyangiaceae bacterium]
MPIARLLLWLVSLASLAWCGLSWPHLPRPLELGLALGGLVLYATWGVLWPQCGMYGQALARGQAGARRVALTFDDGPHPFTTRAVLELLRAHDARATFFVLGHKVEAHPDVVREIHAAGHSLGIHGFEHDRLFSFRSPSYTRQQIERTRRAIADACGVAPELFRPPVGFASYRTFRGAEQAAVRIVAWSVRSLDGLRSADPQRVAQRVIDHLEDGAIVLLHDSAENDDFTPASIAALPAILRALHERGLASVSVEQIQT